jgi:Uma2 family endonuclease
MTTAQPVSVEEYLHTSFEYDAEYVEGKIVYRSLPKKPHSRMQGKLHLALHEEGRSRGYEVWLELRIRTRRDPARFRVPDLCMTPGEPDEDILTSPPFLCVEILSPEDSALELRTKVDEFLTFGVPYVWVIDPTSRTGEIYTPDRIAKITSGQFTADQIRVDLNRFD